MKDKFTSFGQKVGIRFAQVSFSDWWIERLGGFVISDADFIIVPSGTLTLQGDRVTTHQITVSVPLNR